VTEDTEARSYESASARIEEIIRRLDSGEAGLRETLDLCREGRELVDFCARELEAVAGLDDPSAWLDDRRFHYDAVIVADGGADTAAATQPQALRLSLADLLDACGGPLPGPDLSAVLAEAGIAPATAGSG